MAISTTPLAETSITLLTLVHRVQPVFLEIVMSCMRVCRKQALSRVKYYYYATISKIQQATIMTV